jgi:hypothetical protein
MLRIDCSLSGKIPALLMSMSSELPKRCLDSVAADSLCMNHEQIG